MAKRLITITLDDDVYKIIQKLKDRDMNRSAHINSLLRYSERCNFIIDAPPKTAKVPYDSGVGGSDMDINDPNHPDFVEPDWDGEVTGGESAI